MNEIYKIYKICILLKGEILRNSVIKVFLMLKFNYIVVSRIYES
jgi:hypothetical protein